MKNLKTIAYACLATILVLSLTSCGGDAKKEPAKTQETTEKVAQKMKMTTDIPASIPIADEVETRFGTLTFDDGFPTEETAQKLYDQIDFQRAVECVTLTTSGASLSGFRNSLRKFGPDNETMIIWEDRMDSKVILLTPNTTVVYTFMWIDLKDGPMVMETPPNTLGLIDDFWFQYVTDYGNAGPDQGKGGKYLLVPPGYEGKIPDGYFVAKSATYGNWLVMRGFMENFDPKPVVKNMKENFKLYPLGDQPKSVNFVNVSGKAFNTVHASDFQFFEEVNAIVQEEPASAFSPEILGYLASIGIEKGKPFAPDARMKKILTEAALVGNAYSRVNEYRNRDKSFKAYPGSQTWETGFPGNSSLFEKDGVRLIDQRLGFHYYATGITPAMVTPPVGKGSQYMKGMRDSEGNPLSGDKQYKLHIPANVPAVQFWDVTVYDVQTRSLLQTDYPFPGVTSSDKNVVQNADGSFDVYFSYEKPEGNVNWIQTVPGKNWHMLWRIYGPLEPWFDKTWRPGEIELVK